MKSRPTARSFVLLFALALAALPTFSADTPKPRKVTLKGTLMDIACATERADDLDTLRIKHTKKCLQMPECEKSGYALLTADNKVVRFDPAGNEKVKALIASTQQEKELLVKVSGKLEGDRLTVKKVSLVQ
ncbi:MAG TPA: hypothetical protein VLA96_04515 [Terriglobales bacterium]|nr:hypothetical protein [Terriglobales bacterium]